jgi:hypothetical protein
MSECHYFWFGNLGDESTIACNVHLRRPFVT